VVLVWKSCQDDGGDGFSSGHEAFHGCQRPTKYDPPCSNFVTWPVAASVSVRETIKRRRPTFSRPLADKAPPPAKTVVPRGAGDSIPFGCTGASQKTTPASKSLSGPLSGPPVEML
jgi:hypothetical protein